MSKTDHIASILSNLPESPGVYCMKDKNKKIIYVGKSVNLRSRVNSYWNGLAELNFAKQSMIAQVRDIEIIETRNELEALVLETNLIKEWKPKYNILMKDDKNLAYIRVTKGAVPEVTKARNKELPGEYFGPYTAWANVTEILKILRRIFHIRSCRVEFIEEGKFSPWVRGSQRGYETLATVSLPTSPNLGEAISGNPPQPRGEGLGARAIADGLRLWSKAGRSIPCIDHYIGLCPAPCLLEESKLAQYADNIARLKSFLSGKNTQVLDELRARMQEKARALEFEEAQKIKLQIEQIEKIGTKQIARDAISGDYDIVIALEKYEKTFFGVTEVRDGEVVGVYHTEADNRLDETSDEIFEAFLVRRYFDEANTFPKKLSLILRSDPCGTWLCEALKARGITTEMPSAGSKYELQNFTEYNLTTFAYKEEMRELSQKTLSKSTQIAIMEQLGYAIDPKQKEVIFECYDISHTAGQFTVASRSVIVNGKSEPNRYRKYKIKTLEKGKIDDFASLKEVLSRRALEARESGNWPDLIVIDGGKGQLSSVMSAIKEALFVVPSFPFASPSFPWKRESQEDSSKQDRWDPRRSLSWTTIQGGDGGEDWSANDEIPAGACPELRFRAGMTEKIHICSLAKREEEIFVPGASEPILFQKGTPELMLLQRIRDEAHRFAIGFNRSLRNKAMKKNILDELPGFGPATRKKLLKLCGSMDAIKDASQEDLEKILTRAQYETLREHGMID